MKLTGTIFILMFYCLNGISQGSFFLNDTIQESTTWAGADELGQSYLITQPVEVKKYSREGRLLSRYSHNRLGLPDRMDLSNPLKPLIWYDAFKTIVWLNRSLTEEGSLSLIDAGYPEVRAIALARDGNIWVYDEPNFRLKKLDMDGKLILESMPMNTWFALAPMVICIREGPAGVFVSTEQHGLLQFDAYGQFRRSIPTDFRIGQFVLQGNRLSFEYEDKLVFLDLLTQQANTITKPETTSYSQSWLSRNRWFTAEGDKVYLHEFINN